MTGWKKTQSMSMLNNVLKIHVVEPHASAVASTVTLGSGVAWGSGVALGSGVAIGSVKVGSVVVVVVATAAF